LFSEPAGCGSYSEMPSVEIAEMKQLFFSFWESLACIYTHNCYWTNWTLYTSHIMKKVMENWHNQTNI